MIDIRENISISPFTTFKIGGVSDFFCEVKDKGELKDALAWAREKALPIFILGGGSNILVSDGGIRGLTVLNNIRGMSFKDTADHSEITLGSGEDWDGFVEIAAGKGLAGLECLSGIPGKVGAALMQNIGAYGQNMANTFLRATVIDTDTFEEKIFSKEDCGLGYRTSRFKTTDRGRYTIADVTFGLRRGTPSMTYHDVKNYFASVSGIPSLMEVRNAVIEIRKKKGMVVGDGNFFSSAGSFFVNPVVSKELCEKLRPHAAVCNGKDPSLCKEPWFWKQMGGRYKISAACLMNMAGFYKGMKDGGVGLSPHHTLAVVNYGGAGSEEVLNFARKVQMEVKNKFGVDLEIEPDII